MSKMDHPPESNPIATSLIGADIIITGNIEAKIDLHIDGSVIGDIRCSTLILGENSSVCGGIYADRLRVSGIVDGSIEVRELAIEAGASVKGEVTYSRIRVSPGGVMEGKIICRSANDREGGEMLSLVIPTAGKKPKGVERPTT
jgi:cytoskeletal protein CcmA (bactofilin family)